MLKRFDFVHSAAKTLVVGAIARQFSKKVFVKPYAVWTDKMLLNISLLKGDERTKSKGTVLFEFIPTTGGRSASDAEGYEPRSLDLSNKKTFALSAKSVEEFYLLDIAKGFRLEMEYIKPSTQESKQLIIVRELAFDQYVTVSLDTQLEKSRSHQTIRISVKEFGLILHLMKMAYPILLGWEQLIASDIEKVRRSYLSRHWKPPPTPYDNDKYDSSTLM
eukprot:TRINITY_DN6526_c0_g1_i1.p1 TRINITY_DN6526_c0_g1~~TRINITY_DN6526_c0_g1_i1.p1  ORF type:complete len:219 (+),score=41.68 TRINITY_DN6526_c0_g1_i1:113-769(+)